VGKVIIAYEPVWSIGEGGIPADPDFANAQHRKLKTLTAEIAGRAAAHPLWRQRQPAELLRSGRHVGY
jgi:triosephosphate isomerase